MAPWGIFFSFFSPCRPDPLYCTVQYNPAVEPAAKSVGEPYDRADRYSLMILIFEKHLGEQPQLSGAKPILMIFSPILTSKMLPSRSKCGVIHPDGKCAAVRVYKRVREKQKDVCLICRSAKSTFYVNMPRSKWDYVVGLNVQAHTDNCSSTFTWDGWM